MLKKIGLLALALLGMSAALPAVASAQDGYYYGRPQGYYYNDRDYDRHARHEWREQERRERRWREHEWREHRWRDHDRYENYYWNRRNPESYYYNNYYGYPR